MSTAALQSTIDGIWDDRKKIGTGTTGDVRDAVDAALDLLDSGQARVAEKNGGEWRVNQWLKKAVLLSFRLNDMATIDGGPGGAPWFDKVRSKFEGWDDAHFRDAGFRAVPNCIVRHSAYIAPGVILMPSFVNLGAYVDTGTMVDTWATVGSCAQIGKNCHISGGAGIGGVLEPLQYSPVIIEDHCFIGARSEVVADGKPVHDPVRMARRAVGVNDLAAGKPGQGPVQRRVGGNIAEVDIVDVFQERPRFHSVVVHQSAHGGAGGQVIGLAELAGLFQGQIQKIRDISGHPFVDLGEDV